MFSRQRLIRIPFDVPRLVLLPNPTGADVGSQAVVPGSALAFLSPVPRDSVSIHANTAGPIICVTLSMNWSVCVCVFWPPVMTGLL